MLLKNKRINDMAHINDQFSTLYTKGIVHEYIFIWGNVWRRQC